MREGRSFESHGGGRRLRINNWGTLRRIFWMHQGSGGDGNPIGMAGAREGRGGRYRVVMVREGRKTGFFWYAGMEKGGTQVGG